MMRKNRRLAAMDARGGEKSEEASGVGEAGQVKEKKNGPIRGILAELTFSASVIRELAMA
jgi:hypothetical protein